MANGSGIFSRDLEHLSKKYSKRIVTGRVLMFVYSGLCFISVFPIALIEGPYGGTEPISMLNVCLILILVFFLLGLISLKKPFVPLVIASSIASLLFLGFAILLLESVDTFSIDICFCLFFGQSILLFFLIRGAVFAGRKMKLEN